MVGKAEPFRKAGGVAAEAAGSDVIPKIRGALPQQRANVRALAAGKAPARVRG